MDKQLFLRRKAFIGDPGAKDKLPYVLDYLLEAGVLGDEEIDSIKANLVIQNKVRLLVDTVMRKGKKASSELLNAWTKASASSHRGTFLTDV